jgi:hypothetical protein
VSSDEEWRSVPGYDRYQISNRGRIKRLERDELVGGRYARRKPERLLRPWSRKGYLFVLLYDEKHRRQLAVHRLVLLTFAGECPPGMETRHLNGVRDDNRWPENLCWWTPSENVADAFRHGKRARGPQPLRTDAETVGKVLAYLGQGVGTARTAKLVGVADASSGGD